jgi:hypothetical protein
MDESFETICSLISPDLLFHISSYKTPNEAWATLEGIFGKHDEMRGHMLEVEFLTLDPKSFDNIHNFFTKFKDLLSQLKACGVDKSKEEKKWFSPSSPKLVLNSLCSCPHSIQLDFPLEPPRIFLLLRTLLNP